MDVRAPIVVESDVIKAATEELGAVVKPLLDNEILAASVLPPMTGLPAAKEGSESEPAPTIADEEKAATSVVI